MQIKIIAFYRGTTWPYFNFIYTKLNESSTQQNIGTGTKTYLWGALNVLLNKIWQNVSDEFDYFTPFFANEACLAPRRQSFFHITSRAVLSLEIQILHNARKDSQEGKSKKNPSALNSQPLVWPAGTQPLCYGSYPTLNPFSALINLTNPFKKGIQSLAT